MSLQGVDAVVLAARDLAEVRRFMRDWGVRETAVAEERLEFSTVNGTTLTVGRVDDADFYPGGFCDKEPGLREVVWGAATPEALAQAIARAEATGPVRHEADGSAVLTDPDGLAHRLRLARSQPVQSQPTPMNGPQTPNRIDRRAPVHERAVPLLIGHVVLFVAEYARSLKFYTERLGFIVSDSYPDAGAFLRAQPRGVHHNAFILERPGKPGLNHIAFTVSDIHEVFGGGLAFSRAGWPTELGPGRHPISSAYFWYFKSPFGGAFEYYADDDFCTEDWQPGEFERRPEVFAEWAISGGLDGETRRQARGPGSGPVQGTAQT